MLLKKCCCCKEIKSIDRFSKNRNSNDGFKRYCKDCARVKGKDYRTKHREKVLAGKKLWYKKSKEQTEARTNKELEIGVKICSSCKIEKSIDEFYKRGNGGFYNECKSCEILKQKIYALKNRDRIIKRKREYNLDRKKEIHRYNLNYYKKNSEDIKMRVKVWIKENPVKAKELNIRSSQIRLARKNNVISNFSKEDWRYCKEFFKIEDNYTCAYCGKITNSLTQDHFIPLYKGGNYTKDNIIPVCSSCNSSKCNKDFNEWYITRIFYSKERISKINLYFNSIK